MKRNLGIALLSLLVFPSITLAQKSLAEIIAQEINTQVESSTAEPQANLRYTFLADVGGNRDFKEGGNPITLSTGEVVSYRLIIENSGNKASTGNQVVFEFPENLAYYFSSTTSYKNIRSELDQDPKKHGRSDKQDGDNVAYNSDQRTLTVNLGQLDAAKKAYVELKGIVLPNSNFGPSELKVSTVSDDTESQSFTQKMITQKKDYPQKKDHYFILDFSFSMNEKIGQLSKLQIAKSALTAVVESLSESDVVALRIYGSTFFKSQAYSCKDSVRVLPYGPLDATAFSEALNDRAAVGYTPIAQSLERALVDINEREKTTKGQVTHNVILLSDGKDSCGGRIPEVAMQLLESEAPIVVNTIGFALSENDKEGEQQLKTIAEVTGGQYTPAG